MEEKNLKKDNPQSKKLTYEELENVANQLSQQLQHSHEKLQELNVGHMFKRLDYLFKVIEFNNKFDTEFVIKCTEEIESLMTIPKEDTEEVKSK